MPPYKGKKVVYYQDPRFKDKAFKIPAPDMKTIFEEAKKYFPSRKKKRIEINPVEIKKDGEMTSEERIEYVKSVDVLQIIPDAFDLFSA
jgi:type IV secretion system protein VirD4